MKNMYIVVFSFIFSRWITELAETGSSWVQFNNMFTAIYLMASNSMLGIPNSECLLCYPALRKKLS